MSFLYLAGDGLNILERAVMAPVANPVADSLYPLGGLYDGRFSPPFKWGSAAAAAYVTADLNIVPTGDGEGVDFSDWTTVAAAQTVRQTTSSPYSGTSSVEFTYISGVTVNFKVFVRVRLRAGEKARFYHAASLQTGDTLEVSLTCENTQQSLSSGGAWTTLGTVIDTVSSATWADGYVDFTAPSLEELGSDWGTFTLTAEIDAAVAAALTGWLEFKVVPGWDFVGLFGHGSTRYFAPEFRYQALSGNDPLDAWSSGTVPTWARTVSGYDGGSGQLVPADDLRQQAVFNYLSSTRYERWVEVRPTRSGGSTPPLAQGFGELVIGKWSTFLTPPAYPVRTGLPFRGQTRHNTRAGDVVVYNPSRHPTLEVPLILSPIPTSDANARRQVLYLFHHATRGGRYPMIVCPTETEASEVYYGALANAIDLSRDHHAYSTVELNLQTFPMPDLRILGLPA